MRHTRRKNTVPLSRDGEDTHGVPIDSIPVGILITTPGGKILDANQAFLETAGGYSMDELLAMKVQNLYVDPSDRDRILTSLLENSAIRDFETEMKRKDGKTLWVSIASMVQATSAGGKTITSSVQEITEHKQAEEALRESEEMYRTLVDTSPDAIVVSGEDETITNVSDKALEMFGYERDAELLGRNVFEIFAPEEREKAAENRRLRYEGRVPGFVEYTMLKKDGTPIDIELSESVFHDSAGRPQGIIGVARDITERKKRGEELERMNAELEGFAYTVSHDLRGPLASLLGANMTLQLLLKDPDVEDFRSDILEITEIIDTSTARAEKLISDVLSLAETAQVPKVVSDVDVSGVVEKVLEEREKDIAERGIETRVGDNLGNVVANPTHVYQIFANLIGNAIVHNDSDSPRIEISYPGDDDEGGHRYLVRDNGSGIPPEDLERIFIPFFKGKSVTNGIGLSTVEKILGVYDGEIKAYNDDGVCFEFLIRDFHVG